MVRYGPFMATVPRGGVPVPLRRLLHDPYLLLAIALVVPPLAVLVIEPKRAVAAEVLAGAAVLAVIQAVAARLQRGLRSARALTAASTLRLLIALAYVTYVLAVTGGDTSPLVGLYVPVVTLAAAIGLRQALVIGTLGVLAYLVPELAGPVMHPEHVQRGVVLATVSVILVIGARRMVGALERALDELRSALTAERRSARQIAGIEAVGRILASAGPTSEALSQVMSVFVERLDYRYVAIYLSEGGQFHLGAQQGYAAPIPEHDSSNGVIARVIRTRRPAFVPDVTVDPDYTSADPAVRSEICVPLLAHDELLGILNIESTAATPLDETDLTLMVSVADRLAAALALGRERQTLAARVALLDRLRELSAVIGSTLEPDRVLRSLVAATRAVFAVDAISLTVLERASGRYLVRASEGPGAPEVGTEIRPGVGTCGRAIRDRTVVLDRLADGDSDPDPLPGVPSIAIAAGVPIVRDGAVVGSMTIGRTDPSRPFTELEQEAMTLLAGQAALAIANAFLHAEVAELAIRDPLTGLHNRRFFEEVAERILATQRRRPSGERPPISAILFDLDRFGRLNERHGHQAGDAVLRAFGELLRLRFRESDLVARVGGEEFAAILEGASLADTMRVAEEVRAAFRALVVLGPGSQPISATVSAGCATLDAADPTREALMRAADVALYMAKHGGRDRVAAA